MNFLTYLLLVFSLGLISHINAEKIQDIANIVGVRDNQLIGYGLVVGLNGTGDGTSSIFTAQSLANMLDGMDVKVNAEDIKSENVAAVMVTSKLPTFGRQGDKLDVLISSIGDAESLEGGTLLLTPLKGVDGKIYAIGQGPISIGGKNDGGAANHPLAATIYGGAVIENETAYDLYNKKRATLSLKESSFANAVAVQNQLNKFYGERIAVAIDPRTIRLNKPENMSMVEFLASVQDVEVGYERKDRIVIDERTGTIVAGIAIPIDPVLITHGDITIKISPEMGREEGETAESTDRPTVANVAKALQKMGAKPEDIIAILQGIKKAGAISVDLEII